MHRSHGGQMDMRTVAAQEAQAEALDRIARWPADIAPAVVQALQAMAPVFAMLGEEMARCRRALERIAAAHDGIEPRED